MHWREVLSLWKFNLAVISSALINLLGLVINVHLWIRGLNLSLVEHWLESCWSQIIFSIDEFDLQEVLTIIKEVGHEIYYKLFQDQTFVNFEELIKAWYEGVHLLIDRGVVCDLCLNYGHILRLAVLSAELHNCFVVLVNLLLKCNLSHIKLIALRWSACCLAIHIKRGCYSGWKKDLIEGEINFLDIWIIKLFHSLPNVLDNVPGVPNNLLFRHEWLTVCLCVFLLLGTSVAFTRALHLFLSWFYSPAHLHVCLDAIDWFLHFVLVPNAPDYVRVCSLAGNVALEYHLGFAKRVIKAL